MSGFVKMLISAVVAVLLVGCGGGSSQPIPPMPPTITVAFAGTLPSAVATQAGSNTFTSASLSGNTVGVNLAAGTTNYAIAYVCPNSTFFMGETVSLIDENIIEATVQDGSQLNLNCGGGSPGTVDVTVSVDASAISGTTSVTVYGTGSASIQGALLSASGSTTIAAPPGTEDLAFVAQDNLLSPLAVKIFRSQNIPGPVNGGNPIVFGPGDAITMQPFTIANVPATAFFDELLASYRTANGTSFPLGGVETVSGLYRAVPAAATQSGDSYLYNAESANTDNGADGTEQIIETTTTGGGTVTFTLPSAWSFSGPEATAFPTFTFNYPGFSGSPVALQTANLTWDQLLTGPSNFIGITATANFQQGATTLTIPNLSSLSGFPGPISSGTKVLWSASIIGGKGLSVTNPTSPSSANETIEVVGNSGSFTVP